MNVDEFVMVPAQRMIDLVDPLSNPPWEGCFNFSRNTIRECLSTGLLDHRPWDSGDAPVQSTDIAFTPDEYHARRTAFLVNDPSYSPILLDVGIPGCFEPKFLISDGNHRLAAALYRNDPWIAVSYSGEVKTFREMFPKRRKPTKKEIARHSPPGDNLSDEFVERMKWQRSD